MRNAEFSNFTQLGLKGSMEALPGCPDTPSTTATASTSRRSYCREFEVDIDINILLGMERRSWREGADRLRRKRDVRKQSAGGRRFPVSLESPRSGKVYFA